MQINRDLCPDADRKRSCRGVRRDNPVRVPTDNTVIANIDAGDIYERDRPGRLHAIGIAANDLLAAARSCSIPSGLPRLQIFLFPQ